MNSELANTDSIAINSKAIISLIQSDPLSTIADLISPLSDQYGFKQDASPVEFFSHASKHQRGICVCSSEIFTTIEEFDTFLRRITDFNKSLHLIMTFNHHHGIYLKLFLDANFTHFLIEPFSDQALLDLIHDLLALGDQEPMFQSLDKDGNVLNVNSTWLKAMGYEEDEVLGNFFGDFMLPESRACVLDNFPKLKNYGQISNVIFKLKRKDGVAFEAALNGTALYDKQGNFIRTQCELRSIDYFRETKAHIQALLRKETTLRNMMNCMVNVQQALHQQPTYDKFRRHALEIISRNKAVAVVLMITINTNSGEIELDQSPHPCIDFNALRRVNKDNRSIPGLLPTANHTIEFVDDISKLEIDTGTLTLLQHEHVKSFISIPIASNKNSKSYSSLNLFLSTDEALSKEEMRAYSDLAETFRHAKLYFGLQEKTKHLLDNLKQQSITDPLTGLYNRRYIEEQINAEISRCKRYAQQFSLIMFDIDHFKGINDTLGHQTGDKVLKNISELVLGRIRTTDKLARIGGEEFLLLCPHAELNQAKGIATELCTCIASTTIIDAPLPVTCSFGVIEWQSEESIEEIFKRVDENMYKAKEGGRNRVVG
ncbi:GGDEF domain-containing protein [Mariprofundus sp. NF]|uniref:sensor domain-containing diguanylate cyclase n=1 Tax=Mariprofundus sp. NF TaxID=2608716 RepID=UPI0015A4E3A6|nr:GGDEF domain-containing protein [Mariprofundus sp. NF]NWF39092.1 GGDEF domain-containing protein [Mariprofundus sp. NF]